MSEIPPPDLSKWPSLRSVIKTGIESHDGREQHLLTTILNSPSIATFRNSPSTLLAAIDEYSRTQDFLISVGPDKAAMLSNIVKESRPRVIVELGGYLGYSAILFADAMKKANHAGSSALRLYSLELDPEFASIANQLIALAGLSDIVKVVVGSASSSLKTLVQTGELKNVDLLFLDHVERLYVQDFHVVEELGLLQPGVVVVADNVLRPGAPEYRELMRGKEGWTSEGVKGFIWPGELQDELELSKFVGNVQ